MKKIFIFISLIFCLLIFNEKPNKIAFAKSERFLFDVDGRSFEFNLSEGDENLTKNQKLMRKNIYNSIDLLEGFGLTNKEILNYIYPETKQVLDQLKKNTNKDITPGKINLIKNQCNLVLIDGKDGKIINEEKFYNDFILSLKQKKNNVKVKTEKLKNTENLRENMVQKSCFSTNFQTSSFERKNNIKTALKMFDGLVLEPGEVMSFNKTTGNRNSENGYMEAKIIKNGTFLSGFGGGVCQVSTTVYNACLLAGLEIIEVNNHSLPVSYIEPSFDAMVNVGSSDLVVRNNTDGKIVFTSSYENDICKVKIFGKKNKYKIKRVSEKVKIIPAEKDIITTDFEKFDQNIEIGEVKRISYPKDGYESNGYLKFLDQKGNVVKTEKIRHNVYSPTKGIIVKREK
ncbi:MAG: VanW family protein [Clostridia bacterium]|nr:VanW family protein [Clostridia bacterium]